jgi:hypothetical protein
MNDDIPNYHVSWRVRDAWLAVPPCNYKENPYCHVDCPYFDQCNPNEEEEEVIFDCVGKPVR